VVLLSISSWGVKEMKRGAAFLGGWVWEERELLKRGERALARFFKGRRAGKDIKWGGEIA
jgi:hypothetical protein